MFLTFLSLLIDIYFASIIYYYGVIKKKDFEFVIYQEKDFDIFDFDIDDIGDKPKSEISIPYKRKRSSSFREAL